MNTTIICILIFIYYRGDLNTALVRALEDPPYGRHLESAKVNIEIEEFKQENLIVFF